MDDPYSPPIGNYQRRYRLRLARLGWHGMCTYVRAEHRLALEHLRDEYRLPALHDALYLALSNCRLAPFRAGVRPKDLTRLRPSTIGPAESSLPRVEMLMAAPPRGS